MLRFSNKIKAVLLVISTSIIDWFITEVLDWTMIILGTISLLDIMVIVSIIIGVILIAVDIWKSRNNGETTLDPNFRDLEIYYSQKSDTPNKAKHAIPYYVVYKKTKQAYHVPDLIAPYVKQYKIQFNTYDGEEALNRYFKKIGITINPINPSPEELGLILKPDGSLILQTPEPQIVTKLKGRKLEDLQMLWIYPCRYRCHFFFKIGKKPPAKRILRKISTNQTFSAPTHDLLLTENQIISKQQLCFCLFDNINWFSKRKGYTHQPNPFTEKMLLAEK